MSRSLVAVATVFALNCPDNTLDATEILLTLSSTLPVTDVELRARNIRYERDTITQSLGQQNIVAEPLFFLITPTVVAETGDDGFLLYAKGFLNSQPVVAASEIMKFVPNRRVEITVVMEEGFVDADDDGFPPCNSGDMCDCNDSNPNINTFTLEDCDDFVDNNCSGLPINEGCPCRLSDPPVPCTGLPTQFLPLAGVGACFLGFLDCLDDGDGDEFGISETECSSGSFDPSGEVANNFIDDDCDGTVDEGSACSVPGQTRACLLGFVDDPSNPDMALRTAASDRALGECATGLQTCTAGVWGDCLNDRRPQRNPVTEFGWIELPAGIEDPQNPGVFFTQQCNGLDDDCDGMTDEEPFYDGDGDGFTYCGTCSSGPGMFPPCSTCDGLAANADLCNGAVDCDDSIDTIHPPTPTSPQPELCGHIDPMTMAWVVNQVDEDCRCDHDPMDRPISDPMSVIGKPYNTVPGSPECPTEPCPTQCSAVRRALDCTFAVRSDATDPGDCFDMNNGPPYHFGGDDAHGYFDPLGGQALQSGDCWYCNERYGFNCPQSGLGACSTKAEDCEDCQARKDDMAAAQRPLCAVPDPMACTDTTPANWLCAVGDPSNECARWEGVTACDVQFMGEGPYFWGVVDTTMDGLDNPQCYFMADGEGLCETCGTCLSRDAECDCTQRQGGPYDCVGADRGRPHEDTTPACDPMMPDSPRCICYRPSTDPTACRAQNPGTYVTVNPGEDPYADCTGNCDGTGQCAGQPGDDCGAAGDPLCDTGLTCIDGVCCQLPGVAMDCGECERCDVAGSRGACTGITAPNGRMCTDDCDSCVSGSCTPRPMGDFAECMGMCQACTAAGGDCGAWTGVSGSSCADADTFCCNGNCVDPPGMISEYMGGCGTGDCAGGVWECNGMVGQCSSIGQPCDYCMGDNWFDATCDAAAGSQCNTGTSNNCTVCTSCADLGTTTNCVTTGGANSYAAGNQDSTAPGICSGASACDGIGGGPGSCKLDLGGMCGVDDTLCASGNCVDGVCCSTASCGTCQTCAPSGTCTNVTAADGNNCNAQCTRCSAGSCVTRGAGSTVECGTCEQCTGGGGACSPVTAANGNNCTSGCNHCVAGSCMTRSNNDNTECPACQRCNGGATTCQNVTANDGPGCNNGCNQCVGGSCVTRSADDNTECGTCERCNGSSTLCQNVTADDGQGCTSACNHCVAGTCTTRVSGDNVECPACRRCNGSSTSCQNETAADGNLCNNNCTRCSGGSCVTRVADDNTECGTCERCNGSGANCQLLTQDDGPGCTADCNKCVSGTCTTRPANENNECGTCERCNGSSTSCQNETAADGNNCTGDCNECNAGSCDTRLADDNVECGTCERCNGVATSCQNVTADDGPGCNNECTHCVSGSCNSRSADDNTECMTCERCNGISNNCQNETSADGNNCTDPCTECVSGSCNTRVANDSVECAACNRCNGTLTSCVTETGSSGNNCNADCSECVAGSCDARSADDNVDCGTCERCNGSSTVCQNVTANDGDGCVDDCTHCVSGVCTDRPLGAHDECTSTCEACDAAGAAGSCATGNQTEGFMCTGTDTYCCGSSCVDPAPTPSELGGSCGVAGCVGGFVCAGGAGECSTNANACNANCASGGAGPCSCNVDGTGCLGDATAFCNNGGDCHSGSCTAMACD